LQKRYLYATLGAVTLRPSGFAFDLIIISFAVRLYIFLRGLAAFAVKLFIFLSGLASFAVRLYVTGV